MNATISDARICVNCAQDFTVDTADQNYGAKLGVPTPTHCPQCRMQRRLAFRNERSFYKRPCDMCKGSFISSYARDAKFPVYCTKCWWSDGWDGLQQARQYDFSRPFFEQFRDLANAVPRLGVPNTSSNVNSDYGTWLDQCKNCYLLFGSSACEEVLYSELLYGCRDSLDLTNCNETERSYECVNSKKCYGCVRCVSCVSCNDCYFSFDCRGSSNCFLSYNLRNKSYYFLNEQLAKEVWHERVNEILGSYTKMQDALRRFEDLVRKEAIHRYANFVQVVDSTGNDLFHTKNAQMCFDSSDLEDCRYVSYGDKIKDCQDAYAIVGGAEQCYEYLSGNGAANSKFVLAGWDENLSSELSQHIIASKDTFGCVGLRKQQYCIFNKQYEKGEYEKLVTQIKEEMVKHGEYGEYFPIATSDFAYNETIAQDYYPLSKDEALAKGYRWRDDIGGTYGKGTLAPEQIPDKISEVPRTIINEVLTCVDCSRNYRIIDREYDFYVSLKLPIPRQCTNCRYHERLKFRNPRRLWSRTCMCKKEGHFHAADVCPNKFETTYAPTRSEIVFDDSCYQAEVV